MESGSSGRFTPLSQFAARHHLRKAVAAPKLLLQFLLVEPLTLEGVDLYRVSGKA